MKYIVLLIALATACAPIEEDQAPELASTEQAAWEGCFNHIAVKMRAGTFNLWNWSTWSVQSFNGAAAPWQSEGVKYNLTTQLSNGQCQYHTTGEAFNWRDIPTYHFPCYPTFNSQQFYCVGTNTYFNCPVVGVARPYSRFNDGTGYTDVRAFDNDGYHVMPTNEHIYPSVAATRNYDIGLVGDSSKRRLVCAYNLTGKMVEYDRWQ